MAHRHSAIGQKNGDIGNVSRHRGSTESAGLLRPGRTRAACCIAAVVATGVVSVGSATTAAAQLDTGSVPTARVAGKQPAKTFYISGKKGIYPRRLLQSVTDRLYLTVFGREGLPNPKLVSNGAPASYTVEPHTIVTSAKCFIKVRPTALSNHGSWVNNRLYFGRWSRKGTIIKPCATGTIHNVRDPSHAYSLTLNQTCPRSRPAPRVKVCRAMAFRPTIVEKGQAEASKLTATLGVKLGSYGAAHKLRFDEGGFSSSTGPYMHRVEIFFNRSSTPGVPHLKKLVVTVAKHHRLAVTPYFF